MDRTRTSDSTTAGRAPAPAVRRLLAALLAAVQLLLVLSPMLDRDLGESARVHVEEQGVQLHWSHDSAECASCAQRHLVATPPDAPAIELAGSSASIAAIGGDVAVARSTLPSSRHSRAPPSAV